MSANDTQVGGRHYKTNPGSEEHWDRVHRLGLDYFQGQITKYVERWKLKGGTEDLRKAQHFLSKYIELMEKNDKVPVPPYNHLKETSYGGGYAIEGGFNPLGEASKGYVDQ